MATADPLVEALETPENVSTIKARCAYEGNRQTKSQHGLKPKLSAAYSNVQPGSVFLRKDNQVLTHAYCRTVFPK